jgi:hypothetical protein
LLPEAGFIPSLGFQAMRAALEKAELPAALCGCGGATASKLFRKKDPKSCRWGLNADEN